MKQKIISILFLMVLALSLASAFPPTGANEQCVSDCVKEVLNNTFIISNPNEVSADAQDLVDLLKNMNFGLGSELDACQAKLDKADFNKVALYFSLVISLILVIWKTIDIITWMRKEKDGKS